ncbi:hypothetical protein HU200_012555 [Digitaria exilis]|uniref:Uncharacterized protein n=1 Tax=Digitaria exilis TaxID=1010633 RepID=A0A835KLS1_9POAL|nr:hypothetical protein HU200_012555 [Digitaria exilis]
MTAQCTPTHRKPGRGVKKKCDLLGRRHYLVASNSPNTYVNGMQHLILYEEKDQLVSVEVEGNIQKIIPPPVRDYDTRQWVLKDTVSFSKLFGENYYKMDSDYNEVAIHPDHNLVYLVQHRNQKLLSYNMDSKQVRDVCTLGHDYRCITPYVPYFSELSSLENNQ